MALGGKPFDVISMLDVPSTFSCSVLSVANLLSVFLSLSDLVTSLVLFSGGMQLLSGDLCFVPYRLELRSTRSVLMFRLVQLEICTEYHVCTEAWQNGVHHSCLFRCFPAIPVRQPGLWYSMVQLYDVPWKIKKTLDDNIP